MQAGDLKKLAVLCYSKPKGGETRGTYDVIPGSSIGKTEASVHHSGCKRGKK
jgi:hypothetical protein